MSINILHKSWKYLLSLCLGGSAFFFWINCYPAHLSYQEQFQLFQLGATYWWERVCIPGGVADYVAEFLTQFYYYTWAGALIIALLYIFIQAMTWLAARKLKAPANSYPLSFLLPLLLWRFMTDENAMLAFAIALIATQLCILAYNQLYKRSNRLFFTFIALPTLYWIAGPVHYLLAIWIIYCEYREYSRHHTWFEASAIITVTILWSVACPLLASMWVQYPLQRLFWGISYHRYPTIIPPTQTVTALLLPLLPIIMAAGTRLKSCIIHPLRTGIILVIAVSVAGYWAVRSGCDMAKEETMEYDYLARNAQWHDIIAKAEKIHPSSPLGVTCLNLALGMTGQLGDRMFEFFQNGVDGLLPDFRRDFILPLPVSEAYYYLGMVNTAQRFTFEAMESIPNHRKSTRCIKRLAETNLINGQYKVAAKYLRALQKTLFYKDWANEAMTYLNNEAKINAHPLWGRLRQLRYNEDFLFSEREKPEMLGLLYQHNHSNRLAFEYMLGYLLQERDLQRFMKYYPLGKDAGYDHIPRSYQEALVYVWTQSHKSFQGMPWSISPQIARNITEFARIYTSQPGAKGLLQARFKDTYWYYLLMGHN